MPAEAPVKRTTRPRADSKASPSAGIVSRSLDRFGMCLVQVGRRIPIASLPRIGIVLRFPTARSRLLGMPSWSQIRPTTKLIMSSRRRGR